MNDNKKSIVEGRVISGFKGDPQHITNKFHLCLTHKKPTENMKKSRLESMDWL